MSDATLRHVESSRGGSSRSTAAGTLPVLWHIKISNYNEKARWALDHKRVPHRRRAPMPGSHMLVAFALTRRVVTFPVLTLDGRSIGDSTRIIAALEEGYPDHPLYPANPRERRLALELEDFFDEELGHDVRRVVFSELLRDPDALRSRASEMTTERQGAVLARGLPAFAEMLRRRYAITPERAAHSALKIRAAMRLIEETLDGAEHLVGDAFTVADLTAASLLGPLLAPPQFPYGARDGFPEPLEELAAELEASDAGQWVVRTYASHRPPSSEVQPADS